MRYLRMTIVSLFTAAAITLPVEPHAAAANTTLEAENMVVSPASAGRVIADSSASGGYALELYQNSSASTNLSLPASISVVIRAKGQSCHGAPSMSVLIDGNAISATTVSATSWTNYTTAAMINAGTHTLSIAFTNARQKLFCSRALFLDTVTVVAAGNAGGGGGAGFGQAVMSPPPGYASATVLADDVFSGTTLSTSHWVTYYGAQGARWADYGLWPSPYSSDNDPAHGGQGYMSQVYGPDQVTVNNGLTLTAITPIPSGVNQYNPDPAFFNWYSGIVNTMGKAQLPATGWYVQIRAKRPDLSYGAWPAIWFMPDTGSSAAVEFDGDDGGVNNVSSPNTKVTGAYFSPSGQVVTEYNTGVDLSAGFHTYGFEFLPPGYQGGQGSIKSYIDGNQYFSCPGSTHTIVAGTYELMISLEMATAATSGWHTVPDRVHNGPFTWEVAEVQIYKAPGT